MKKILVLATVLTLGLSGAAIAKGPHHDGNGFAGEQMNSRQCMDKRENCPRPMMGGGFMDSQQTTAAGGFQGPSVTISTVEQAKQMRDDQKVALRGYIIQSLGGKDYLFKDDTGTIEVEIDHKRWRGQVITPNDLVEIQGKVDKDWNSLEIDVKHLFKVNTEKAQ